MATVEPIKGGGAVQVVVLYGVDCRRICSAHGRGAIVVQVKDPAALTPAELAAVKAAEAPADALALADARMIAARFAGENPGVPTAVTTAAGDVVDVYQDGKPLGVKAYPSHWDGGPAAAIADDADRRTTPPADGAGDPAAGGAGAGGPG